MNKKFMMFHLASDLCFEDAKGWSGPTKCKAGAQLDYFKERLKFCSEVSGNKVSLLFDGRSREARKLPLGLKSGPSLGYQGLVFWLVLGSLGS